MSKDSALVVWESSLSLDQMQQHIQSAEHRKRREREEGVETALNKILPEESLNESDEDDQSHVAMEMDAVVTRDSTDGDTGEWPSIAALAGLN